jgi:hypothetical protein
MESGCHKTSEGLGVNSHFNQFACIGAARLNFPVASTISAHF